MKTLRHHCVGAPIPDGWRVADQAIGSHHNAFSILIEEVESPMDRKACLDAAAQCVLSDRNGTYGSPEDSFAITASLWSTILHRPVTVSEVALCLAALKMARLTANPSHADSWVDLAGYASIGAEVSTPKERRS